MNYEEVVAGCTAQLGADHTRTLTTKGNLASLLKDLGERAEARRLGESGPEVSSPPTYSHTNCTLCDERLTLTRCSTCELNVLIDDKRRK